MGDFALYLAFMIPPLRSGWAFRRGLRTFAEVLPEVSSGRGAAVVGRSRAPTASATSPSRCRRAARSDHYDPRKKALFLSEPVYQPPTIACGGRRPRNGPCLQDARLCTAQDPVGDLPGSRVCLECVDLASAPRRRAGGAQPRRARAHPAVAVAFHIVTLPVEFNASRRAAGQLREVRARQRRRERRAERPECRGADLRRGRAGGCSRCCSTTRCPSATAISLDEGSAHGLAPSSASPS